ncbi:Uncharacterised protein [Halioglobus japonicus]|nr:Uncharacterised protein [Halioglobus japonicus]
MSDQLIIEQALSILETRLHKPECIFSKPDDTSAFLTLSFNGLEYESFRVLLLDSQNGLIKLKELFRGTIDGAAVYPREVVKAAIQFNAAAVIFAHNHPSGVSEPSSADRRITERLVAALGLIDVRVLDHIVVGGTDTYSFAQHGLL